MPISKSLKLGDVGAIVRGRSQHSDGDSPSSDPQMIKRQVLADFCRLAGARLSAGARRPHPLERGLPPRVRQTLECLLAGDSEKQIAAKLGISRHTIHVYVKDLHKRFAVSSRGELLAKWVQSD